MLMLVSPEDNSQSNQTSDNQDVHSDLPADEPQSANQDNITDTPSLPSEMNGADNNTLSDSANAFAEPSTPPISSPASSPLTGDTTFPQPQNSKPKGSLTRVIGVVVALIVIVALCVGAFALGKHHEKVVIRAPQPQPVSLPPQAVVLTNCLPGRGKQYIIPKDIPNGPIYDVENSKVIAIEYNLNIEQLLENSDTFSNAILSVTKNYPVNHLSIEPASTSTPTSPPSSSSASAATASESEESAEDVHLIMFMVSKAVSNAITCSGTSTSQS